jgi:drug/metabolite transporter (DMT)-like permease
MTLAASSWGLGIVMTKITLDQLTPLDVLGIELVVGAAVIWGVLLLRGGVPLLRGGAGAFSGWRGFAVLGFLEPGLSYGLGDFGLDRTGAADAALLTASESLFAVMLARMVLSERLSPRLAVAVGVGFGGSILVGIGAVGGGRTTVLGDLLVLASAAAAAAYSVAARRVASGGATDAVTVTAVQLAVAALATVPLVAIAAADGGSHLAVADSAHLLAAVATGLLTTALPFLLYNVAIRDVEVAEGALILNLVPAIATGLAVVLLGERLGWLQVVGGAAVILAALGAESRRRVRVRCGAPAGVERNVRAHRVDHRTRWTAHFEQRDQSGGSARRPPHGEARRSGGLLSRSHRSRADRRLP